MKLERDVRRAVLAFALAVAGATGAAAQGAPPTDCVRGRDLMTEAELEAQRAKVRAASAEEKLKLRAAHHAELEKRAAAKGQKLCAGGGPGEAPPAE